MFPKYINITIHVVINGDTAVSDKCCAGHETPTRHKEVEREICHIDQLEKWPASGRKSRFNLLTELSALSSNTIPCLDRVEWSESARYLQVCG